MIGFLWNRILYKKRKRNIRFGLLARIDRKSTLESDNYIGSFSQLQETGMGRCSYMGIHCFFLQTKIGRYTSIGDRVKVISGTHPIDSFFSTSPVFYARENQCGKSFVDEDLFTEHKYTKNGYLVEIGSDVWIGSDVKILQGVTIGDGAVIGAGSLVTQDIEPYSVAYGVPAKMGRKRFDEKKISELTTMQWWNWDEDRIKENIEWFIEWFHRPDNG